MNAEVKKIIVPAIIVITALLIIDVVMGAISDNIMTKLPSFSGQIAKDNYRLNKLSKDIVIIGSSRGSHHYVTNMLGDSINHYTGKTYSIYNAAIDGKFINSNSCATESILNRYSPKMIIFEVSSWELRGKKDFADVEFAAPHYRKNAIVRKYLNNLGWKEQIKMKSSLFRYNRKLPRIASSFLISGDSTGYEPLYNKLEILPQKKQKKDNEQEVDSYSLENFSHVLETCHNKEIPLVIVSSPKFRPTDSNEFLQELCDKYQVPYIELYNLKNFNGHPELFQDAMHLNDDGARLYTNIFFNKLKPHLSQLK